MVSVGAPLLQIFQPSLSHQKEQMRAVGSPMVPTRNATPMSEGRVWRVGGAEDVGTTGLTPSCPQRPPP